MKKNLTSYDILYVAPDAPQREIHAAYRRLAMAWHPDKHHGDNKAKAHRYFNMLQEAYDKVKTPVLRESYDNWLRSRTNAIMVRQNTVVNDNQPVKSFFETLETIFWPIERHRKD